MTLTEKQISDLRNCKEIQCQDGNWNYDPYMRGMANGLILALAIFERNEPIYFEEPKKYLKKNLHWAIRLRKKLLIKGSWKWNAWVRDITAYLEK